MALATIRRGTYERHRGGAAPGWTFSSLPVAGPSGLSIPVPPGYTVWFKDGFDYSSRSALQSATFSGQPVYSVYSGQDGAYTTSYWDPTHVTCTGSQVVLSGFFDTAVDATRYVTGGLSTGPMATSGQIPPGALWLWCMKEEDVSPQPVKVAGMTYGTQWPWDGEFLKNGDSTGSNLGEWPYDGEADVREGPQGGGTVSSFLHWSNAGSVGSGNPTGHTQTQLSDLTVDTTQWVIHGAYVDSSGTYHSLTNDAGTSDATLREWATQAGVDQSFSKAGRRWIVQQEANGQPAGGTPTKKVYVDWVACLVPTATGWTSPPAHINDLTRFKLTLPIDSSNGTTGTATEWLRPQLDTAFHGSFFSPNSTGDGTTFLAPCNGAKTGSSDYARSELREMNLDGSQAAWSPGDGATHSMQVVMSIDHLPDHRPIVCFGQTHGPGSASFLLLQADGFYPTTAASTTYVKGGDAAPFTLKCKINDSTSTQVHYDTILSGVHLGDKFTYKLEAGPNGVKVYADLGVVSNPTLRVTYTDNIPASGCYFKVGCYDQSGDQNSVKAKTVPSGTCPGGASLTAPIAAGQPTGNPGVQEYGQTTIYGPGPVISHGTVTATAPSDFLSFAQKWKITLPITSSGALGPNGAAPLEITRTALDTYSHAQYFYVSNGVEVVLSAPASGATTSNTANPRCELRERNPPALTSSDDAAWTTSSGVHTLYRVGRILQLPQNKPQLVIMQAHDPTDDFEIIADGFCPTDNGTAVTGTNPGGFCIAHRNWAGTQQYDVPILAGVHIGDIFSIALQFNPGNSVKMYADFGVVDVGSLTLRKTFAGGANKSSCYFKAGSYTQANSSNSGKTVPSSHFPGMPALTSPAPGSSIAGEPAGSAGISAIRQLSVTHA